MSDQVCSLDPKLNILQRSWMQYCSPQDIIYMCVCVSIYNLYIYIYIYTHTHIHTHTHTHTHTLSWCCSATKPRPTLCDPMDYSQTGSSVHGVLQAGILEGVTISFFREFSRSRDQTCISCIGRWILYHWAIQEERYIYIHICIYIYLSIYLSINWRALLTVYQWMVGYTFYSLFFVFPPNISQGTCANFITLKGCLFKKQRCWF